MSRPPVVFADLVERHRPEIMRYLDEPPYTMAWMRAASFPHPERRL